jgi:hypothetical protein
MLTLSPSLWAMPPQHCEDLEDGASLAHLYRIVKMTIMLNDAALLEEMLKEVSGQQHAWTHGPAWAHGAAWMHGAAWGVA